MAICTFLLATVLCSIAVNRETTGAGATSSGVCRPTVGLEQRTVTVSGRSRTYLIEVPPAATQAPVVLAFHGYSSSAERLAAISGLAAGGAARGDVVVFPQGWGEPARWAVPGLRGADDVAFVDALMADLVSRGCGDHSRVSAVGFSNGAAFVAHLACVKPGRFRALGFVSGANLAAPCAAARTPIDVPVVIVHGVDDRVVPVAGGPVLGGRLTAETLRRAIARWRDGGRRETVVRLASRTGHTWPSGTAEVILATFDT